MAIEFTRLEKKNCHLPTPTKRNETAPKCCNIIFPKKFRQNTVVNTLYRPVHKMLFVHFHIQLLGLQEQNWTCDKLLTHVIYSFISLLYDNDKIKFIDLQNSLINVINEKLSKVQLILGCEPNETVLCWGGH